MNRYRGPRWETLLVGLVLTGSALARQEMNLAEGWRFIRSDVAGAEQPDFGDRNWQPVTVPHCWGWEEAESGNRNFYRGPGWYRRELVVPADEGGPHRRFLWFGAASTVADVYLNGKHLGQHRGGFGAFCIEITDAVRAGKNVLAVRVNNAPADDIAPLSGDFNVYGGLYRPVRLLETDAVCINPLNHAAPGLAVQQKRVGVTQAELTARVELSNGAKDLQAVTVHVMVRDHAHAPVVASEQRLVLNGGQTQTVELPLMVKQPHLWNGVKDPYLYEVVAEIRQGDRVLDRVAQPLGLRDYYVDPEKGFFLNGQPCFVRGANRHQDRLGKGWAITPADMEEDVALLREMGANAVRCCHYQHSGDFYAACDRAGLLVWAELPLVNTIHTGTTFAVTTEGQLLDLIRQNINHPAIFAWSLFNEQSGKPDPTALLQHLHAMAKTEDSTRPTIAATCVAKLPQMNKVTDWLGWNRYPMWYGKETPGDSLDACRHTSRDGSFILSEYGAGASIQQHEQNPKQPPTKGKWHPEEWQANVHEAIWAAVTERPFIWGTLAWVMFDFSSQQRDEGDFPVRNDKGLVTGDRKVKKDAFFFYKANWTDAPMVYITSRRDVERKAARTPVKIYANTDHVELKINGVSQGVKTPDALRRVIWTDVELKPGTNQIEAVGTRRGIKVSDCCAWHLAVPNTASALAPQVVALFDGRTLNGWKEVDFGGRGEIRIKPGGVLEIGAGDMLTGLVYTNTPVRMNYEIRLEGRRTSGSDFFCGLTFPVGTNCCTLILGGWGGSLIGLSSINGMDASENETGDTFAFEQNRWYDICLRVTSDKIEAWLNGRRFINVDIMDREIGMRPGEIEACMPLGLATWKTTAELRNMFLFKLSDANAQEH